MDPQGFVEAPKYDDVVFLWACWCFFHHLSLWFSLILSCFRSFSRVVCLSLFVPLLTPVDLLKNASVSPLAEDALRLLLCQLLCERKDEVAVLLEHPSEAAERQSFKGTRNNMKWLQRRKRVVLKQRVTSLKHPWRTSLLVSSMFTRSSFGKMIWKASRPPTLPSRLKSSVVFLRDSRKKSYCWKVPLS